MTLSPEALGERVRRALAAAGLTQAQLAQRVSIDPSALSRSLAGHRNFKSLEIARIAEVLDVSTQQLLSDEEPRRAALAARAQPDAGPGLRSALDLAAELLDLDQLLAELGFEARASMDFPAEDGMPAFQQGEKLAGRVRVAMGIGDQDLPYELADLASLIEERLGIDIGFNPLPPGLDGLSARRDSFSLALVSSGVAATRQRFTLAHELGHLSAGDSQEITVDENVFGPHRQRPDEQRANGFAAAFLMPAEALRAAVPPGFLSEAVVAELLARYGVSLDALAFRLHNVGLVNASTRNRIRSLSSSGIALRNGRTSDLQARNDRRVPGSLLHRAIEAYVSGGLSIRPLATLLRVEPDQLLDELSPLSTPEPVDDDRGGLVLEL
jgi:Zn-dependent peptidase ImmA (M78 family)/transcriptional regulator with XRE-family HTH domain